MKKELPDGWEWKKLGDIIELKYGKGLKKENRQSFGNVSVYGSNGIVGYHDEAFVNETCLIVGRKGSIGAIHISNESCWPIDTTYYIVPPKELDVLFLFYLLSTLNLDRLNKSTAIPGLNRNDVYSKKIPLPPIEIQHKIVAILEKAEETKKLRAQADELTQQFLQSVFLEMFGDSHFSNEDEKLRIKLKNVINIIVPTRDKPKSFTGNIPWITLPDLTSSIYIDNAKHTLSYEEAKPTKCRLFPEETVILSCAGSLGKVAIAKKEVYTNQQFYGLVCDKDKIIPEFLAYHLLFIGESFYKSIGGTSTITFFKKESALNIEIILPNLSKQIEFSKIVRCVEKIKSSHQQSSQELNILFNALMQKAFNGELVS